MIGYIYKTTNLINNKIYVGQKKASKFLGNKYLGSGKILKLAIEKYGKEAFIVELLDSATSLDELGQKEQFWIEKLDAQNIEVGYNRSPGGLHVPISGDQNGFYGHVAHIMLNKF